MFGVKMIETCIVPDEKREWMAREKKNLWAQIATHLYWELCSCIVHRLVFCICIFCILYRFQLTTTVECALMYSCIVMQLKLV